MTVVETTVGGGRWDLLESPEIQRIRTSLRKFGWALTHEDALGLQGLTDNLAAGFQDGTLTGKEMSTYPIPRSHVRDVVEYRRDHGGVSLNEYYHTDGRPRAELHEVKRRVYKRILAFDHPPVLGYLMAILSAVPEEERKPHGTLGVDFLQTYGEVVPMARHQDKEEFTTICLVEREGRGATTTLYRPESDEVVVGVTLQKGQVIIFRDKDFTHGVTRLEPRFEGDKVRRSTLVATIHYWDTYLGIDGDI